MFFVSWWNHVSHKRPTLQFALLVQRMVFSYKEIGAGETTSFALCPSGYSFHLDMWLLTCHNQLSQFSGSDVDSANCVCQAKDVKAPCCPQGPNGVQAIAKTEAGHHYYVLAMARPPDTGESPDQKFLMGTSDASGETEFGMHCC